MKVTKKKQVGKKIAKVQIKYYEDLESIKYLNKLPYHKKSEFIREAVKAKIELSTGKKLKTYPNGV